MNKWTPNGGPAFPSEQGSTPTGEWNQTYDPGMSLRDYFAGQALMGHLASMNAGSWGNDIPFAQDAARGAYLVADAMIDERNKGG